MTLIETLLGAVIFASIYALIIYFRKKHEFSWTGLGVATAVFVIVSLMFAALR